MMALLEIIVIVFGILQIILFFKIWGMTNDVKEIKNYLCSPKVNYETKDSSSNNKKNKESVIHKNVLFQVGDVVIHKDTKEELVIHQFTMNDTAAVCINKNRDNITYYLDSLEKCGG